MSLKPPQPGSPGFNEWRDLADAVDAAGVLGAGLGPTVVDRHPNCIHPLCGCAGTANCKSDPMNTPLPADVKVGHTTFRKGVSLRIFVEAARRWHREAFPEGYILTDEQKAANLARLQGKHGVTLVDGQSKPLSGIDADLPLRDTQ